MKYILTHKDNSKLNLHTRTPYSSVLEAQVSNAWQGYNELTLKVSVEEVPGWKHFDKIQIEEIDFFLHEWNASEHVDERISTYILHFYGPEKMIIEASPLTDMDEDGVSVFRKLTSVTGDLPFFGNMICNCINYRHYDPQTGLRVKENTVKLGAYPADTKHLNVDFSESNAFAGLKAICEKFGVSYTLERNAQEDTDYILNFGTEQSVFPVTLSYGKGKGLYSIRRKSLNTKNIKTILTVLGSSSNLPADYGKNNLELDPTLYPGSIIADATKIAKYGAWNDIYQNEEIMPSRLGTITAIDEADVRSFFDDTLTFDPTGGTVNIMTGQLAGNNFTVKRYNAETHKITVEPLTDTNGFVKPSVAPYLFSTGDEYYIVGIPMPASYLEAAQEELAQAGNAEYDKISQPQVAYEVSLHGKFLRKHEVRPRVGMYLPISDVRWGVDKAILIIKVKRDLLKQDDWEYECEISDDPGESLAVSLYKQIQQTGINNQKQEKNQISYIAALRSFAEEKASESLMASESYAVAQAEAARIAAQAYADGEIDAEEARAIADATAKMNEAKSYALAQASAAESAAKTYAEAQAAAAQSAAEAVAEAEAAAAEVAAKAYADGVVSIEEQRAIAEAAAKLTEAKNHANAQAAAAESAANTYSEAQAESARLAAIASAKTYTDTEVTAAKGYADSTAAAAQSAAQTYALAKANLAETNAEAYADGIVTAEEAARIAEAQAKLNEAKTYAEQKATTAENAAKAYADTQLGNFATTVTADISDLQNQIDGSITTHFFGYVPTTSNAPANAWTTTALKNQHLGDLFYDTETGFCYRYQLSGGVYSWQRITDSDVTKALADAAAAQDTADSKRRVFVATPVTPYDIGDLWLNNQELYKCKVTRLTGSYVASDWEKGVKYTDDTVANANLITAKNYADTKKAEAIAAAEAVAAAEALAAQTAAEAHADGIVTAEEQARIADVNAKLATAQSYAETKASEAQTAAEAAAALDATAKANAAKTAAESYALAKANLAETTAKAYADGIVDSEEARAIADATAKMNEAKSYALAQASAAESAAKTYAEAQAAAAQTAAEAVAEAEAAAAEVAAKAYADGVVDAEEARAIADATTKANAAKAAAEATAAALDAAIQVGGRNLTSGWDYEQTLPITSGSLLYKPITIPYKVIGRQVTVSFYAKSSNSTNRFYASIAANGSTKTGFANNVTLTTEYTKYIYTFIASSSTDVNSLMFVYGTNWHPDNVGSISLKEIKLELGNKPTDWTPAPEDVQAEIDAADAAAATAQSTANSASTAASNAQTSANTANNLLSDIANDNKLTASEKQETKKEWDAIVSEKTKNDSQADTFGVSKTAYGTAYNALNTYITPLLSNLTTTSDITGTTFRSTFKAYYDARTDLLNAIAAKARTLANTAQTAANNAATAAANAQTSANSAATAASNAQTSANNANTAVSSLNTYVDGTFKDGVISQSEAQTIEAYINLVNSTKTQVDAAYTKLYANSYLSGTPKTNLNSAKTAVNTATTNLISSITTAIADGKTTTAEKTDVDTKYTAFNSALSTYQTRVEEANVAIQAAIRSAAAGDATTTAASDATNKVTAAKNAIAQEAGYADFADMASKAALTVNGLLNSNIINTDQILADKLLAFSAFVNYLTVRQLQTLPDTEEAALFIGTKSIGSNPYSVIEMSAGNSLLQIVSDTYDDYVGQRMTMQTVGASGFTYSYTFTPEELRITKEKMVQGVLTRNMTTLNYEKLAFWGANGTVPTAFYTANSIKLSTLLGFASVTEGELYKDTLGRIFRKESSTAPDDPVMHFGTAITGITAGEFIYSSSGVANALAGDYYINISTGGIYKCTLGGTPAYAKWSYQGRPAYSAADVGAVPTTRTVNSKALSANISLTAADVGAAATSHGNHVPTTGIANNAIFLRNDNTWQYVTPANIGAAAASHTHSYAAASHTHTKSQITDFPSSMPASDVYAWAKASAKPSYTASEVGALATNTIQYFTQAQWDALTQAQKDAVPLAVVGE